MFRAVHLDQVPGLLYLHSMPGRCESIESFLREYGTRRMTGTICLNDDQGARPNAAVVAAVHAFLEELCPRPSSFELTGA